MILRVVSRADKEKLKQSQRLMHGVRYASVGEAFCGVEFERIEIVSLDDDPFLVQWLRENVVPRLKPELRKLCFNG